MTDRAYENLPTLIGELKRAMIDAYMKSQGWDVRDGNYNMSSSSTSYDVTRPGADGEGGGDWDWNGMFDIGNDGQDAKWMGAFDQVRSNVDATMKPWLDLPDTEADLTDDIEGMRQANRLLSFNASDGTGAGNIGGYLTGIHENSDSMSGPTIASFKANFLLQLEKAIGGHHGITVILGGAIAASNEIWVNARQTVADIVGETTAALTAYALDSGPDWDVVLKVAGHAVEGVAIFATGGASKALQGAAQGLKILTAGGGKKGDKASQPALDYHGLSAGLGTALDELSQAIKAEEQALRDNLVTNAENVRNDQSSYDLARPTVLDITDDSEATITILNQSLVNEIIGTYMPLLAGELDKAGDKVYFTTYQAVRDDSIGIGYNGISTEFADLQFLLRDLLKDLSWETLNSAKTLELAVDDIGQVDTSAEDALEKHAAKVHEGSGYDPWD